MFLLIFVATAEADPCSSDASFSFDEEEIGNLNRKFKCLGLISSSSEVVNSFNAVEFDALRKTEREQTSKTCFILGNFYVFISP